MIRLRKFNDEDKETFLKLVAERLNINLVGILSEFGDYIALSRKHEFEADAFECAHAGKEAAISAMKKLYREDLGNLTPHPFVVKLYHSHPTASQRIAAFEKELKP